MFEIGLREENWVEERSIFKSGWYSNFVEEGFKKYYAQPDPKD